MQQVGSQVLRVALPWMAKQGAQCPPGLTVLGIVHCPSKGRLMKLPHDTLRGGTSVAVSLRLKMSGGQLCAPALLTERSRPNTMSQLYRKKDVSIARASKAMRRVVLAGTCGSLTILEVGRPY
jgi:hypothetical protein